MARKRDGTWVDKRRKDTKERFVQFALDQMGKVGYLNFNYGDTARSFGIASSALYNYFETKEHLLRELLILVSQNAFDRYRAEYGESVDSANPIDALVLFGKYVSLMFQKEKHMMDFLFFSPTALGIYAEAGEDKRTSFNMLREIYRLIDNIIGEHLIRTDRKVLLIKWWSFIHGYTLLASSGIIEVNDFFIRDAVVDIIAGDNLKSIVEKVSVKNALLNPDQYNSFYYTPNPPAKSEIPSE